MHLSKEERKFILYFPSVNDIQGNRASAQVALAPEGKHCK